MKDIANHANLIWSIAELLRGDYKQSEYGRVIQPLVVMRRLDQMMEADRDAIVAEAQRRRAQGIDGAALGQVLEAKFRRSFFNTSPLRLHQLLDDPPHLRDNLSLRTVREHRVVFGAWDYSATGQGPPQRDRSFILGGHEDLHRPPHLPAESDTPDGLDGQGSRVLHLPHGDR